MRVGGLGGVPGSTLQAGEASADEDELLGGAVVDVAGLEDPT
jgi:hypothetical protein